jgi:hypothetical protein
MDTDEIRTLTIQSKTVGVTQSTAELSALGDALDAISTSADQATDRSAKFEAALAKQRSQLDQVSAVQDAFNTLVAQNAMLSQSAIAANDNVTASHSHLTDALRLGVKASIDYASSWLATAGAVGAGLLVFGGACQKPGSSAGRSSTNGVASPRRPRRSIFRRHIFRS